MIIGIDEAGRGCVIGPMVICAAAINSLDEFKLKQLGVKDSKKIAPLHRRELFPKIREICKTSTVIVKASEINKLMDNYNLNEIEAMKAVEAIEKLGNTKGTIFVDSPDNPPKRFADRMRKYLKKRVKIVSENRADDRYLIVGAASIIAKVTRDREIEKIKEKVGYDFNSGYTSDPFTIEFLQKHVDEPRVRKYIRTKWSTVQRLKQKKLHEF